MHIPWAKPGSTFNVAPLTSFDDQRRDIDLLEVLGEVGLRERLDAGDDQGRPPRAAIKRRAGWLTKL